MHLIRILGGARAATVRRAAMAAAVLASLSGTALAEGGAGGAGAGDLPHPIANIPFVIILLCIAVLPLIKRTEHWWHANKNKLLVSAVLGTITLVYYGVFRMYHGAENGLASIGLVLDHAVIKEYIPFIVLLLSLYTIAGGIELRGDLKARPFTNTMFLAVGTAMASFVGTTGAAMLLIRPLLRTNKERRKVVHTVIFFIFAVCNCGGLLLPIGDPPLFLGYLRGVPFDWTLQLLPEFLVVNIALLVIYYIWDRWAYAREEVEDIVHDETEVEPLSINGKLNFLLLAGVVCAVAFLDPSKPVVGTDWKPPMFLREAIQLVLAALSFKVAFFTPKGLRERVSFDFFAIAEVACLFIGIFITMQVPLEVLNAKGGALGVDSPMKFFWITGILSSFLDNAPTYVVFFETARQMPLAEGTAVVELLAGNPISEEFLIAISLGAVFMGANTYIGNGPNFLVKAIAEQAGVKMPSFFGYMKYSVAILIPLFAVVSLIWFL